MAQLVERLPSTQNIAGSNPEAARFVSGENGVFGRSNCCLSR